MAEQVSAPGSGQPQDVSTPTETKQGNWFTRWFKRQSTFGKIRIIGAGLVLVIGVPYGLIVGSSAPASADVGDCMVGQTAETLKTVECTDPTAEWTVVGRLNDKAETDFTDDSCSAYPEADISYWEAQRRRGLSRLIQGDPKGFILCLAEK